jgi:hypothetical protein
MYKNLSWYLLIRYLMPIPWPDLYTSMRPKAFDCYKTSKKNLDNEINTSIENTTK